VKRAAALLLLSMLWSAASLANPPAERTAMLARGINITGWFRYPASRDPAALRAWLSDAAMAGLKRAGFTFVRLAVDPALLDGEAMRGLLLEQIRRLEGHGLAVVVSPHPVGWAVDTNPADRARLIAFWRDVAPALRALPPALTFPEMLNEPVFHDDPGAWWSLQNELHAIIRMALPRNTIILTGQDWGSIAGLLALPMDGGSQGMNVADAGHSVPGAPVTGRPARAAQDGDIVYSFHFYDPAELTSLAAYRPGLDRGALARLPFPETDATACQQVSDTAGDQPTRDLIRFYCATGWDAARVRTRIQDAVEWARRHGVVLLAGEFGATTTLNSRARLSWLRLVRETLAANGIGWALWGYDDVMGLNVGRPPINDPVLDRSVLGALGLPDL
jgi:endoglucanase